MVTRKENILRAVRFETPEFIPMSFSINSACWQHYPQAALKDLMEGHKLLFPDYQRPAGPVTPKFAPQQTAGKPFTDSWGCVWETAENGITGAVTQHPLKSWDDFKNFTPPDPETQLGWSPVDWKKMAAQFEVAKTNGQLLRGGLRHGHTFLTLTYLRGYESLMFDMFDDEPRLQDLIRMVEEFNLATVRHFLKLGVEYMSYPEDLGMQVGPMLSPEHFRKYIQPSYRRIITPARKAGCIIHMHSDGDIRDLVDGLIEGGVEVINLQDLVNGVDWIKANLTGKVCVDLDIDRQQVTRFGTPAEVNALIRKEVETLGSKKGGLMMIYGMYPGIPLANAKALMDAMEKYSSFYS